ncbi:MAG: DUF4333 domain-containing protein [Actinomycetota bacterium]|nr:DUF4333 domain-containing protein [Actinomycetota bacterium]
MNNPRVTHAAMLALGCGLLLSACGSVTVDPSSETRLVRKALTVTNLGPAKSIDCPSDVAMKVGTTFKCHTKLSRGGSVTIAMKVDKVSGNNGHIVIVGAKQP